jgi:tRNA(Ile2) C34 agmatinyltransferase TiaS
MAALDQKNFIKNVIKIIDRWSFEQCAYCNDGTLVSIEGMLDFRCTKCGKTMNPMRYLGEISKIVFNYREQHENLKSMQEIK